MAKKYGLPYQGSKAQIADKLGRMLPRADYFVDLFAGGCAMSDWALHSKKYKHVIANDLRQPSPVQLFNDAIAGKYAPHTVTPAWVSREEFFESKDTDLYIAYVWSFGNDGRSYIFGKTVEPVKKAAHDLVVYGNTHDIQQYYPFSKEQLEKIITLDTVRERRLELKKAVRHCRTLLDMQQLRQLRQLEQLERLERLQQLEQLERLQQLQISQLDYRNVILPPNSIVYCDPPYKNTRKYSNIKFNHDEFWQWVRDCPLPVFVSEYNAPCDFKPILEIRHRSTLSSTNNAKEAAEMLYWNGISSPNSTPAKLI